MRAYVARDSLIGFWEVDGQLSRYAYPRGDVRALIYAPTRGEALANMLKTLAIAGAIPGIAWLFLYLARRHTLS